jgi:riboflavin synthase
MFTGIVETVGRIDSAEVRDSGLRIEIEARGAFRRARVGDSIAVNGICLTAVKIRANRFSADLSAETLDATTAGKWKVGTAVNLEKSLTPATPLGGHLVSGHVDGVGKLVKSHDMDGARSMRFQVPKALARYIARKGSICVDGVSLTVNAVAGNRFDLMIIPHTLSHTTLGDLRPGDAVNLEVDLIARYLERLLAQRNRE